MKLSMAAEFAVRGILHLACFHGHGPVPLEQICRRCNLARDYQAKIFGQLARAGLVTAVRGKGGGYLLARSPESISLLEVVEAVEGPLAVNLCQFDPPRCEETECPVRPVWAEVQEKVRSTLASKTLAELVLAGRDARGVSGRSARR